MGGGGGRWWRSIGASVACEMQKIRCPINTAAVERSEIGISREVSCNRQLDTAPSAFDLISVRDGFQVERCACLIVLVWRALDLPSAGRGAGWLSQLSKVFSPHPQGSDRGNGFG